MTTTTATDNGTTPPVTADPTALPVTRVRMVKPTSPDDVLPGDVVAVDGDRYLTVDEVRVTLDGVDVFCVQHAQGTIRRRIRWHFDSADDALVVASDADVADMLADAAAGAVGVSADGTVWHWTDGNHDRWLIRWS